MNFIKFFLRRKIDKQIDEFLSWNKGRFPVISSVGGQFMYEIAKKAKARDVKDLTRSNLSEVLSTINLHFYREKTEKCFEHLMKYYRVDNQVEKISAYGIIESMSKKSTLSDEAREYFVKKGAEGGKKTLQEHGKNHFRRASKLGAQARWGKKKLSTSKMPSPLPRNKGVLV